MTARLRIAPMALVLPLLFLVAPRVEAQAPPNTRDQSWRPDDRGADQRWRQQAYDRGFREGSDQGVRDGRDHRAFRYEQYRPYQRADSGYDRSYGDIEFYRQTFRQGFAAGYRSGYYRDNRSVAVPRGSYPGSYSGGYYPGGSSSYGYTARGRDDYAYRNGYQDGREKGFEDTRKHRSYDPLRHRRYRNGDHNYERWYGPKAFYENVYRDGFRAGYDQAYRQGVRYGDNPWDR